MIITLTTDFGLSDPFVGEMKGVILGIAPDVRLVDITHNIESYDVLGGAFALASVFRCFPPGTIHLAIVDPGVGGARRPIAASAHGHVFVGPDNGVLSLALNAADGDDTAGAAAVVAHEITNDPWFRHPVSQTFHGRDIFAPAAARLAQGAPLDRCGPRIDDPATAAFSKPRRRPGGFTATALAVDKFGNVITNLRRDHFGESFALRVGKRSIRRLLPNYESAAAGEFFAIEGSSGYIELSLKRDSAAAKLAIRRGGEIEVETHAPNH